MAGRAPGAARRGAWVLGLAALGYLIFCGFLFEKLTTTRGERQAGLAVALAGSWLVSALAGTVYLRQVLNRPEPAPRRRVADSPAGVAAVMLVLAATTWILPGAYAACGFFAFGGLAAAAFAGPVSLHYQGRLRYLSPHNDNSE